MASAARRLPADSGNGQSRWRHHRGNGVPAVKHGMPDEPRGQILVIVAAGMIVLIAIAALVIDLGFSWMLRRQEQNAADPASLAAARFITEPDPVTGLQSYDAASGWSAACRYARMNGFFAPGNSDCDPEPAGASMTVNWPPQGTVADYWHGDRGHVQVIITASHDSFFGRIFGQTTCDSFDWGGSRSPTREHQLTFAHCAEARWLRNCDPSRKLDDQPISSTGLHRRWGLRPGQLQLWQ